MSSGIVPVVLWVALAFKVREQDPNFVSHILEYILGCIVGILHDIYNESKTADTWVFVHN